MFSANLNLKKPPDKPLGKKVRGAYNHRARRLQSQDKVCPHTDRSFVLCVRSQPGSLQTVSGVTAVTVAVCESNYEDKLTPRLVADEPLFEMMGPDQIQFFIDLESGLNTDDIGF